MVVVEVGGRSIASMVWMFQKPLNIKDFRFASIGWKSPVTLKCALDGSFLKEYDHPSHPSCFLKSLVKIECSEKIKVQIAAVLCFRTDSQIVQVSGSQSPPPPELPKSLHQEPQSEASI
eukprot:3399943-Amphidinium_carterae.1